jgi:P22 tail accessory factor
MAWTKRQLISEAFSELAVAGYDFDITPEEWQGALRRMDSMVATWDAKGVRIGYLLPVSPNVADIDDDSGIPDTAAEAVYLNLAIRLASGFGKALSVDTKTAARNAYDVLQRIAAMPSEQQIANTFPRGAGNRQTSQPFFPNPTNDPLSVDDGGDLDIIAE